MTFRLYKDTATVKRLVTVDGKSDYQTVPDTSFKWYLNSLQISEVGVNRYGKEFRFTTHVFSDIRETDRLVIDGTEYAVSEVIKNENIGIVKTKVVALTKIDNG